MQGAFADPDDRAWEQHDPRYRLFVFDGPKQPVHTCLDITDARLDTVLDDARRVLSQGRPWALALVVDAPGAERGLVWLTGADLSKPAQDRAERAARFEAQQRALDASGEREPMLPDGRRLLRFFPGYAGLPVWGAGPDSDPRTREQLLSYGADGQLVDDLAAWDAANRGHEDGWTESSEGTAWVASRIPLLARLRTAVDDACEVYADGD